MSAVRTRTCIICMMQLFSSIWSGHSLELYYYSTLKLIVAISSILYKYKYKHKRKHYHNRVSCLALFVLISPTALVESRHTAHRTPHTAVEENSVFKPHRTVQYRTAPHRLWHLLLQRKTNKLQYYIIIRTPPPTIFLPLLV